MTEEDSQDNLAPLTSLDPQKLVSKDGKDSLAEFVLALSLVFNDLKGLFLWRAHTNASPPADANAITPKSGEWNGVQIQIHRLIVAQLHELLKLIEEFEAVVGGEEMRRIMKKAQPSVRRQWDEVVRIALGKGSSRDDSFAEILMLVRNNAAYHYYQPKALVAGFRSFFYKLPQNAGNERAYASIGNNMGETRFYFVDAAMQSTLNTLADGSMGHVKFAKRLGKTVEDVNQALSHIISQYIKRAKPSAKADE